MNIFQGKGGWSSEGIRPTRGKKELPGKGTFTSAFFPREREKKGGRMYKREIKGR